jgi:hypothetical protein
MVLRLSPSALLASGFKQRKNKSLLGNRLRFAARSGFDPRHGNELDSMATMSWPWHAEVEFFTGEV